MDPIASLEARLAAAIEAEDFETAAMLRDALGRLRDGTSSLTEQQPGRMGLGTSQEDYRRDPDKPLPKKPDPMTANYRPGGGRRR